MLRAMKPQLYLVFLSAIVLFLVFRTTNYQAQQTELKAGANYLNPIEEDETASTSIGYLPHGIVHSKTDMELKPLWFRKSQKVKDNDQTHQNLLAMAVGIKQKNMVDAIVQKFLTDNFTVILFHYDGNVNDWNELSWSNFVIHVAAHSQTKWWFAKRFLHPDIVSIYDYIFLWDEDVGVQNFDPRSRYLEIMKSEGLEISQPALDPKLSEIHHSITIRRKRRKLHRRVHPTKGKGECPNDKEPPCAGWVEGMAPVFSRSAWQCAWHLIQNDLIHGWGMDLKLGYCVKGERTKQVGVIDSEFIVHQGVQTLGGDSTKKQGQEHRRGISDARVEVRRQSMSELHSFKERWDRATREDKGWIDTFHRTDRNLTSRKRRKP